LPAADNAVDELVCVTAPPSPGLPMRTEMFVFDGCTWVDEADELADCWLPADWPTACTDGSSAAADPAAIAGRRTALAMNARRRRLICGFVFRSLTVRAGACRARRALMSERKS
jgi:hypothetical protein